MHSVSTETAGQHNKDLDDPTKEEPASMHKKEALQVLRVLTLQNVTSDIKGDETDGGGFGPA